MKWVYKINKNVQDQVKKYKARLVTKGYKQKSSIDYDEVFTHIIQMETTRLIIFITA